MPGRRGISKTLTPEQRSERARQAALARTTVEAHIKAIVDAAPPLSDEQAQLLAELLYGGDAA